MYMDDDIDDELLCSIPDASTECIVPNPTPEKSVPVDFPFPFSPYDIQVEFMRTMYSTLEHSKIGIFESPTGTGKSMSIICGAMKWLRDHMDKQQKELEHLMKTADSANSQGSKSKTAELDWIVSFANRQQVAEQSSELKKEVDLLKQRQLLCQQLRAGKSQQNTERGKALFARAKQLEQDFDSLFGESADDVRKQLAAEIAAEGSDTAVANDAEDADLLPDDYDSDGGEEGKCRKHGCPQDEEEEDEQQLTKIFYCSRTHSQLSQFVDQVRHSPYADSVCITSLGSRQTLCVNEAVRGEGQGNVTFINERCLELQKNTTKTKTSKDDGGVVKKRKTRVACPYLKQDAVDDFSKQLLVEVKNIEDLVKDGKKSRCCPYYASRRAVPLAELVVLPYQLLLHKSTREASGIKLKGSVVVIDEAHNLIETITSVHSVEITGAQVCSACSQLCQYIDRYLSRLKASNLLYLRQLQFVLGSLLKYFGGKMGIPPEEQKLTRVEQQVHKLNDFLYDVKLDNVNLYKIINYCRQSKLARKLQGFVEKYQPVVGKEMEKKVSEPPKEPTWALKKFLKQLEKASGGTSEEGGEVSVRDAENVSPASRCASFFALESFLLGLTSANDDGRIIVKREALLSDCSLRFLLLNPAVHFADVLQEARAVIIAGGTMQPIDEFKEQLMYSVGVKPDRIATFSCGHVIPRDHLLPIALVHGPSGLKLDFTYQSRNQPEMMDEVGRVVLNVCNVVPAGVVIFFPSYEYESLVYDRWLKSGVVDKIACKKKIFREPKRAGDVDRTLSEFAACIKRCSGVQSSMLSGAILLCVVGGKMSEGINFSDDLARCVAVVGLPYPNKDSPELKEKMHYLNTHMKSTESDGRQAGQVHYENLCMKAVNQCIGRAVRHRLDYASILLLDHRYSRTSTKSRLPGWIGNHLLTMERFGPMMASLRKFFDERKQSTQQ